jgi:hypothetical protein
MVQTPTVALTLETVGLGNEGTCDIGRVVD